MKHCPNCQVDAAWEKNFVKLIGREMKKRGIAYMVMILREDGKLAYVLDKEIPENAEVCHGTTNQSS